MVPTNDFKSLSSLGLGFSGEAEGFGVMFNLGAISLQLSAQITEPVALLNQEYEFKLLGEGFDEEQGLFCLPIVSGSTYIHPNHMLLSLRYRWLKMGKMEQFGDRDLHMLELASAYLLVWQGRQVGNGLALAIKKGVVEKGRTNRSGGCSRHVVPSSFEVMRRFEPRLFQCLVINDRLIKNSRGRPCRGNEYGGHRLKSSGWSGDAWRVFVFDFWMAPPINWLSGESGAL